MSTEQSGNAVPRSVGYFIRTVWLAQAELSFLQLEFILDVFADWEAIIVPHCWNKKKKKKKEKEKKKKKKEKKKKKYKEGNREREREH